MPGKPPMLPHVSDVLDRLDQEAGGPADFAQQLTASVTDLCRGQGLTLSDAAIERAVRAHLNEGALAVTADPEPVGWGWNRPSSETERRQQPSRWRRAVGWLGERWARAEHSKSHQLLLMLTLLGIIFAPILVVDRLFDTVSPFVGVMILMSGLLALSWGIFTAPYVVYRQRWKTLTTAPTEAMLQRWLAHPKTRTAVRRCLESPLPYLMNGDIEYINGLANEVEATQRAQMDTVQDDGFLDHLRKTLQTAEIPVAR